MSGRAHLRRAFGVTGRKAFVIASVLLAGCAASPAPGAPDRDSFRFVGGGSATTARFVRPGLLQSADGQVEERSTSPS